MTYQSSPARRGQDVRRYPVASMQVSGTRMDVQNAILTLQQRGTYLDVPHISFHPTGLCRATLRYYNTNARPTTPKPAAPVVSAGYPRHPSYRPRQWPSWVKPAIIAGMLVTFLGLIYLIGVLAGTTAVGLLCVVTAVGLLVTGRRLGRTSRGGVGSGCAGMHCAGCPGCR